jgi:MFS family permease
MGLQCLLFWIFGGILPGLPMLRQISNWEISVHFLVRGASPFSQASCPKLTMKASSLTWAVVVACHGAASDFAGIVALRVLLGVFETTISPGLSLVTSLWYKRSEHASRHGIWFAGNSISSIFGGLLTYGIGHIDNAVEPWRVCCLSPLSFRTFLPKINLTFYSGYSLYLASSHSHMELYS